MSSMHTRTGRQSRAAGRRERRPFWRRAGFIWFAFDLLGPTALLYLLIWQGVSLYVALLASAAVSAVSALVSYRRGNGNRRFAPYMLAMALAGLGIALISGSDRFLLAKESLLTTMVGFWFLSSLWKPRPLTYQLTRPLLEGRVGRHGPSWDLLWEREPHFRRSWRVTTVIWAIALLIDAVVRVVMAYTLPVNTVPALQTALMGVTTLLMQVITWVYYWKTGLWLMIQRPYQPDQRSPHDSIARAGSDRLGQFEPMEVNIG